MVHWVVRLDGRDLGAYENKADAVKLSAKTGGIILPCGCPTPHTRHNPHTPYPVQDSRRR